MHVCLDCPTLIDSGSRCAPCHKKYNRERDRSRPSSTKRGYDKEWRTIRKNYLKDHPFCVACGRRSTEVDHIIPIILGGTSDDDNLQALCKTCHSRKTVREDGGFTGKGRASKSLPSKTRKPRG